jgi:diguanylate cyclase (GGDEF)-like protein
LFYLLVAALLGTVVYAGYRQQRAAHIEQRTQLERQVAERTQQLHAANLQLEHASQTDPLTGLRNRRYLANQIPADLSFYDREQARTGNTELTLLFALIDIDHFKRINDQYGHKAGDRVLQQFAQLMLRLVRVGDYVVRWGGEEFLLVFRPIPRQYVPVLGERIRRCVAEQIFDVGDDLRLPLTCSIGLAEYPLLRDPQHHLGWEQMIELADAGLYWVKENGRDGWAELQPTGQGDMPGLIRGLQTGAQALIDSGRVVVVSSKGFKPPLP